MTARHCLQLIWKIGLAGDKQKQIVLNGLEKRFKNCVHEKNNTLIRYDIIHGLRKVYDKVKDDEIKIKALDLIESEENIKYQKKYATLWRNY